MATQHDGSICGARPGSGPPFGRKVAGCPRCDELLAGAPARELSGHRQAMIESADRRKRDEERDRREMKRHFESEYHRSGKCGICCTAFDW